jgi:hypothetical protein
MFVKNFAVKIPGWRKACHGVFTPVLQVMMPALASFIPPTVEFQYGLQRPVPRGFRRGEPGAVPRLHGHLELGGRRADDRGADRGVDGMLYFYDYADNSRSRREEAHSKKENQSLVTSTPAKSKEEAVRQKILVQVKGGGVQRNDVATLLGDVNNQKFAGGILITLEKPTKPMREEAADAGRYESKLWHDKDYPKIQILTIEGLLSGKERVEAPPQMNPFAKAQREAKPEKQTDLI